jgi:SAM-dependent methyltransferase
LPLISVSGARWNVLLAGKFSVFLASRDGATMQQDYDEVRRYYDKEYYAHAGAAHGRVPWHYRTVARRLGDLAGKRVLDVACGEGAWLQLLKSRGTRVAGVDISERAIATCRMRMPDDEFVISPAEEISFPDRQFDIVSCLGSLEHFLDKPAALRQMVRVARDDARLLVLVPNSGFLTRRIGLYHGTQQTRIREDVWSLATWQRLFEDAGLTVTHRWRDLHPLSPEWILKGKVWSWPVRALQAIALPLWPISWQYQVYHLCRIARR